MRPGASITFMFRELPAVRRPAAARAAGFAGIDIQDPDEAPAAELARAARDAGVAVVLLNAGMGDFFAGGPGLSGVPGRQAAFRDAVRRALDSVESLAQGGDRPLLHLGPSRVPAGVARAECQKLYEENLAWALEAADGCVRLVVETLNAADDPAVLLTDLDETAALVRRFRPAGAPDRLGLQFDIYHSARSGLDVAAAYRRHADLVAHVQFADAPGRHEPGTGGIDFAALMTALAAAGHDGWCAAEYKPAGTTEAGLGWRRAAWARAAFGS